ncbi:HAMP domain-containing histidine kinase [Streptomyces sp. LX-29]|uniref:sensor histidine kinase n=1 Tax=Streptomyces sp. LX-29 TaxID=2900152 RepID=UPI00240D2F24|nr:HAMP domain-containing sensor histidine kinase [Streptomyces sp. LX-29]WFB10743.1 HAMP domain-containing histidine kinase [Streptomyces sp. LX-29]
MRQIHSIVQCLLIGTVLTALLVPLGYLYAEHANRAATDRLRGSADAMATPLSHAMTNGDAAGVDRLLVEFAAAQRLEVSVRWPDGTVRGSAVDADGHARAFTPSTWQGGVPEGQLAERPLPPVGGRLSVEAPLSVDGAGSGVLLLRQSATELRSRILTVWITLGLLLPFGVALCALPTLVLRRRTLRDLDRIGDTVRALADGEFHARTAEHCEGDALKGLAAEVNRLAAVIQSMMEDRRSFLADVAHQLRNPMVALRLRLENLRPHLPDAAAERHERLLADVDRLDRTLTEMLEHARSHPADRSTQVVEVCGLVEECVRGWASVAEQRAIRMTLEMPRHAWGLTRPGAVEQALNVLLDNALKYSPEGGVVEIAITVAGPRLRIRVRDEGPGLPDSEREAALERGWSRGPFPSTGIGLSIAVKLIESAGGRLELRSGEGRGLSALLHLVGALPGDEGDEEPARSAAVSASGPTMA